MKSRFTLHDDDIVFVEPVRAAARRKDGPLHAAADAHVAKISVAVRLAFAKGRAAYRAEGTPEAAGKAVRAALLDVLPGTLRRAAAAGANAGIALLRELKIAEFNPEQPRDEHGRWTNGGGSEVSPITKENFDKVVRRAEDIAHKMNVPSAIINVVDKEPRAFEVGNQKFREAGHYDPRTGTIEINARISYNDRMSITNGIVAHEVSHAVYDAALQAQRTEHEEIGNLPSEEFNRLFRASGYARPEMQKEIHERWPVSAFFYRHLGDPLMETEADQQGGGHHSKRMEILQRDDGVSAYSRSYWEPEPLSQMGGFERAMNETLAETTRYHVAPMSWGEEKEPHDTWRSFAQELTDLVNNQNKVKARLGRRG